MTSTCDPETLAAVRALAEQWKETHGVAIQLSALYGRRWAFVCGQMPESDQAAFRVQRRLSAHWGLVIYAANPVEEALLSQIERSVADRLPDPESLPC